MMKAILKNLMLAYSGKCDGLIFYYHPRLNRIIARRMPMRKTDANNRHFGEVASNLGRIALNDDYKWDFKTYTELLRQSGGEQYANYISWNNLYAKMMWAMAKDFGIDLKTLTKTEIYERVLPCITVKSAIDAQLLPVVEGYQRLNSLM